MKDDQLSVPACCAQCPHLDHFHSTCAHPLRQSIIRELDSRDNVCPIFLKIRSEAMRDLEMQLC